jgi:hypothetical protein
VPRLSGDGTEALRMLRTSASNPAHILSTSITLDNWIEGSGGVAVSDSLRYRLSQLLGEPSLATMTSAQVFGRLGIRREGWVEAREYLRQEIQAFNRSLTIQLPAERLDTGGTTDAPTSGPAFALFASTRSTPRPLPPAFWGAVVRFDETPRPVVPAVLPLANNPNWVLISRFNNAAQGLPVGHTWGGLSYETTTSETAATGGGGLVAGRRTLASVLGAGPIEASLLADRFMGVCARQANAAACAASPGCSWSGTACTGTPTSSLAALQGPAQLLQQITGNQALTASRGQVRACMHDSATTSPTRTIRLDAFAWDDPATPTDERLYTYVVFGHEALACAIDGEQEGVPCAADSLVGAEVVLPTWSVWTSGGIAFHRTFIDDFPTVARPRDNAVPVFLVRLRDRSGSPPTGVTARSPGSFEAVTGMILPILPEGTEGYRYCTTTLINPALDLRVRDLLEMDANAHQVFAQTCAGVPQGLNIPLENELTDNSNGVENSWRHYLEMARAAADLADLQGEAVIEAGLALDARSEAAIDEIERICGVSLNLDSIQSMPNRIAGPTCTPRQRHQ